LLTLDRSNPAAKSVGHCLSDDESQQCSDSGVLKTLQKFASFHNHFNQVCNLIDRQTYKAHHSAALAEWQSVMS